MSRFLALALGTIGVFAGSSPTQVSSSTIEPIRVPAGSILAFHLQTRLRHTEADPLDALPQGTVFHVKMLTSIDSNTDRDGSEFRGSVVSDLSLGQDVIIHSNAEVRGLLVLLRSKNHPDGFRYELLLTELTEQGKSYPLTASLHASFFDAGAQLPSAANSPSKVEVDSKELPKPNASANTKLTANPPQ
jgi:hypothetical protein